MVGFRTALALFLLGLRGLLATSESRLMGVISTFIEWLLVRFLAPLRARMRGKCTTRMATLATTTSPTWNMSPALRITVTLMLVVL